MHLVVEDLGLVLFVHISVSNRRYEAVGLVWWVMFASDRLYCVFFSNLFRCLVRITLMSLKEPGGECLLLFLCTYYTYSYVNDASRFSLPGEWFLFIAI